MSICGTHIWNDEHAGSEDKYTITVCTLCETCCEHGLSCKYNGITGRNARISLCDTKLHCCSDCGICRPCAETLWVSITYNYMAVMTVVSVGSVRGRCV